MWASRAILFGAALGLTAVAGGWCPACSGELPQPIDCTARPLDRIPPGVPMGDRPGGGWTHLVFKTRSRLAFGDVDKLHYLARSMAEFLFTAMAARVVAYRNGDALQYRLEAVGIGVGTRIGEHDVIISSDTQRQLGAGLGPLKAIVLSRAEEHLSKILRVAASERMMIVDAPSIMYLEGEHRKIVLRYLFVVNPLTGQLATIVWRIDLDEHGRYLPVTGPAVLVRPNLVATSPLHVDGGKVYWGIPSNEAFAIVRLPPGTPIDVPPELSRLLGQQVLTPQIAWDMEWRFRQAIGFSGTE